MVKISNRLMAAAALVTEGNRLADVGTDHGYVPIYLLQQKKIPYAIAMDINEGPLERAGEHITLFGLGDYIETRLSDGVAALKAGEADTVLIAGMGGGLVMHILEEGKEICHMAKELVLQPQSELERVRKYLREEGYETLKEDMILEEDKFYPMMKVRYIGRDAAENFVKKITDNSVEEKQSLEDKIHLRDLYGGLLLENRHPVLKNYLQREQELYVTILNKLKQTQESKKALERIREVEEILEYNRRALEFYCS